MPREENVEQGEKVNILIVDDRPDALFALQALLEELEENLVVAGSGPEALNHVRVMDFAVILLDVRMPEMDGFEAAARIRAHERSRQTPIIFLTAADSSEAQLFKGYALGAVDYILKPVEPVILRSKVAVFVELTRKTELIKRQAGLVRESEAKYRAIFENSRDAIYTVTREGTLLDANQSALDLFGFAREEAIGRNVQVLYANLALRQRFQAEIEQAGFVKDHELRLRKKDGTEMECLVTATVRRAPDGSIAGYQGIVRDVTERKRAEEETRRLNAELEAANRELEAFSYSVSHDLRAPLRTIARFSEAILEDHGDRLDPEAKNHLQRVHAASQRLEQLIDGMLELSLVSRGEMLRERVDLSALTAEIAEQLRGTEPDRSATFDIAGGLVVEGNPNLLRVLLENLLNNAWKFTSTRPQRRIEFGAVEEHGVRRYFVRDNGVGFDMAYSDRLFTPFQRLHAPGEFPGSGIGLATVQRIVHRHGGWVHAEGAAGQGASFYFTLGEQSPPDGGVGNKPRAER